VARFGAAALAALAGLVVLALAGCGGGSSEPSFPTIGAAKKYELAGFRTAPPLRPGKPSTVSFVIRQPDGTPLVRFKRGAGPHTGVHLIFVSTDLRTIVHRHPPVAADGTVSQDLALPFPGRYRMVVDAYPATGTQPNFQLFRFVTVGGGKMSQPPLPPPSRSVEAGGYRFQLEGTPHLKAIQAALLRIRVTDARGRPASFAPYYGALAHAIFFRRGTLDYFHTHVCGPGVPGCTSTLGGAQVRGTAGPGRLSVGVLVPAPGVWRLFLQVKVGGRVVTAPFTLNVK
jgi:hypothetical protein